MKCDIRFYGKEIAKYFGISMAIMFAFIAYAKLLASDDEMFFILMRNIGTTLSVLYPMLYMILFCSSSFPMAIQFGSTRKSSFWALLAGQVANGIFYPLGYFFAVEPLASLITGIPRPPMANLLAVSIAISITYCIGGGLLGYMVANKGARTAAVGMAVGILLGMLGMVVIIALNFITLQLGWLVGILAGFCVAGTVLAVLGWRKAQSYAVGG